MVKGISKFMIFVFYCDDYEEIGGVGLEEFKNKEEAALFIQSRLVGRHSNGRARTMEDYIIITGIKLEAKIVTMNSEKHLACL